MPPAPRVPTQRLARNRIPAVRPLLHSAAVTLPLLLAGLCSAPPASPTPDVPRPDAVAHVGARVESARRRRLVTHGIGVAVGVPQLGLGVFALGYDRGPGVRRLALTHTISGSAAVVAGTAFLFLPSPLERLASDPEYAALQRQPHDPAVLRRFEARWAKRARRARVVRLIGGSTALAIGVGLSAGGAVRLGLDGPENRNANTVWALAAINTGILFVARGVLDLIVRSSIEQALRAYRTGGSGRTFSVAAGPGLGAGSLRVRF